MKGHLLIHPHALWLCGAAVFLCGLSVGFALGVLVAVR